jgi:hypothetical protein
MGSYGAVGAEGAGLEWASKMAARMRPSRPRVNSGWGLKQMTVPLPNAPLAMAVVPFMTPRGAPFFAISVSKVARVS